MSDPLRGEVWIVDLGIAAKVRPAVVLRIELEGTDRSLLTVVAHTTSERGTRFDVQVKARFLRAGAFDGQNLITLPLAKFIRRLGKLTPAQLTAVETAVRAWLGL